ncbi:hypothetical protein H8711_09945 [Clostridiaceae bacterium NSJ-31]|uniref:Uncharacterized protein n=1 Tax=Ligaoa zhengdingensis TaxID=2763658 RepID=A0A926E1U3_9FIRM|nr:hypothetical protein [Ligaoa zhengdingensis]MBC8547245.1 hypothetical protein [Ligaoa zhengdingensis]DAT10550.1 MAG TPA: hypothetical protein [Caudoviricetes sp.]
MGVKNGASYYTDAELTITIHFPEDKVCCLYCPLCVKDPDNYGRMICFETREILFYPSVTIGSNCAIKMKEARQDGEAETAQCG